MHSGASIIARDATGSVSGTSALHQSACYPADFAAAAVEAWEDGRSASDIVGERYDTQYHLWLEEDIAWSHLRLESVVDAVNTAEN